MTGRAGRIVWGALLLALGLSVLIDLWHTLGRPGGRCPACRGRLGRGEHRCAWADAPKCGNKWQAYFKIGRRFCQVDITGIPGARELRIIIGRARHSGDH